MFLYSFYHLILIIQHHVIIYKNIYLNNPLIAKVFILLSQVSLLLGTIIRKVPLPTSDICGSNMSDDAVLDFKQLETIGNHFLEVLMKMKHNGAIDKTRAGFTALCNRLLCSDNPRYIFCY